MVRSAQVGMGGFGQKKVGLQLVTHFVVLGARGRRQAGGARRSLLRCKCSIKSVVVGRKYQNRESTYVRRDSPSSVTIVI